MKNIIVGTAGHIDHGKTALVKALTGVDADRWAEEKRRGITIDLGFAHLQLTKDIRLGFIDVPGHERFVRNMLAGAAGIDLVLFVISAEEGIKPQTREHFDICRLLGVKAGIIVFTKADLADADILELLALETDEFVAGSFLEGAPKVAVSAMTGAGLPELLAEIGKSAKVIEEKSASGWFRLPVDRAFTMKGFGTVLTGTLVAGSVRKGQEVELHPLGRLLRVRNVQVFGKAEERAPAGLRTALNVPDIAPEEVRRGMVLTEAGRFRPVTVLDCRLELLRSAKPLKNRAPVHFHAGTAEVEGEVRLLEKGGPLQPGASAWVRIVLKDTVQLLPGDRFIIRMFSPVITIGGGLIADISARRYRLADDRAARLKLLLEGSAVERVEQHLREHLWGLRAADLIAWTGLKSVPQTPLFEAAGEWWISTARLLEIRKLLAQACREFHKGNPLLAGIAKQDLKSKVMPKAAAEVFELALAGTAEITADHEVVRLKSHKVVLRQDEEQARAAMERVFRDAGLIVPGVAEVLGASGLEAAQAKILLQQLLKENRLVRIAEELVVHADSISALKTQLQTRRGERFTVPVFKDWTGISRKYAIPLLEHLDRLHITRREGDERVVV